MIITFRITNGVFPITASLIPDGGTTPIVINDYTDYQFQVVNGEYVLRFIDENGCTDDYNIIPCTTTTTTTNAVPIKRIMFPCIMEGQMHDRKYSNIEQGWYTGLFPYQFRLDSLIINGTEYANGEILTVEDRNDLIGTIGFNGYLCTTNMTDWLNTIVPSNTGVVFYDEMCVIDFPENTTFSVNISEANINLSFENMDRHFYYDNIGCKPVSIPDYQMYYVDFTETDCAEITQLWINLYDDELILGYHSMETDFEYLPTSFLLESLEINNIEYANQQILTINNYNELQTTIGGGGRVFITNITDWINSIIPESIYLNFQEDMNILSTNVQFNIRIRKTWNGNPTGLLYFYTNNGFAINNDYSYIGYYTTQWN